MLHRPGSACTGLPELTFLCVAWKVILDPISLSAARYTVDLSEDLLVITLPGDARNECVISLRRADILSNRAPSSDTTSSRYLVIATHIRSLLRLFFGRYVAPSGTVPSHTRRMQTVSSFSPIWWLGEIIKRHGTAMTSFIGTLRWKCT
ncbi:hypothetical protein L227DRAFT_403017 [Lentinus tigrinus ALCF2SS1-6]|uniref:Uncharacterized protein n=1 Tax=Lentinus tigrinus ALCF2SS1-6 TaxID=1328759 RepID=A0A5C2RQ51_9APHY|nr:hypothetical protein L227DRAFT_403017 [Lentinus tigrinus ALCF2SS1-6]